MKNFNDKTLFILGAGASYGHASNNAPSPPIMKNFLSKSVEEKYLDENIFPALTKYIKDQGNNKDLLKACQEIEKKSNVEEFFGAVEDLWVLHLGLFYIYRFLGKYCKNHINSNSAYCKLAKYIKNNQTNVIGVINLNYDTLFDNALKRLNIESNYGFQNGNVETLLHIKPHGSLNFRFLYEHYIKIPCQNWQKFLRQKNCAFLTNKFHGIQIKLYEPTFDLNIDFFNDGVYKYFPCILMPIGKNKDYFQFDSYEKMWKKIDDILSIYTVVISIGCHFNDEDEMLWNRLKNLNNTAAIKIVASNDNSARQIAEKFGQKQFLSAEAINANGFVDYANNYLSKNILFK